MSLFSVKGFHIFRARRIAAFISALGVGVTLVPHVEAASQQQWVSDHLSAYVRSGPTNGYRIVGALDSGTPVQVISTQNDYSQVRTSKGDTVWIPSNQLQDQEGAAALVPALQQQVANLKAELNSSSDTIRQHAQSLQQIADDQKKYIGELESTRTSLNQQLNDSQSQVRRLQGQLGSEHQDELLRYLAYGGGIAGIGLFVGLVLPNMIPKRKKRNDRFF